MDKLTLIWQKTPLKVILIAGTCIRLLAVLLAKGFGMFDDHFLVIEPAQAWADGANFDKWIPAFGGTVPAGHNLFYIGLHYCFFKCCNYLGLTHPDLKMYLIRLLHGGFSLLIVYVGFKITALLSNEKTAKQVGLLLALFWFIPMLSVRNLVEVVCVPFLLLSTYSLLKQGEKQDRWLSLTAGFFAGLAFAIRFQSLFLVVGIVVVLLFSKKFHQLAYFLIGTFCTMFLTHGLIDWFVWGQPFAEFIAYVNYNAHNGYTYVTLPWYNYFLTLGGLLLPPISLFLLFGFFYSWKKHALVFLPAFIFLCFHSYFPNKQERFIFPIIPYVIILGMVGWNAFVSTSSFWEKHALALKRCWQFFWGLNIIALLFVSSSYSKRNRVESMLYLRNTKAPIHAIVVENTNENDWTIPPLFYLGKWVPLYGVTKQVSCDSLKNLFNQSHIPNTERPNYVIFNQEENIEKRVAAFSKNYSPIAFQACIEPGSMDRLLHWLNPKNNDNNTSYIYKIQNP